MTNVKKKASDAITTEKRNKSSLEHTICTAEDGQPGRNTQYELQYRKEEE
jgi:hypothetical protein